MTALSQADARAAKLKRVGLATGRIKVDRALSKKIKMTDRKMGASKLSKRAKDAARTRKSYQHIINARISATHKAKHAGSTYVGSGSAKTVHAKSGGSAVRQRVQSIRHLIPKVTIEHR